MKLTHTLFALALAVACGQALAASPAGISHGYLPQLGENRIVGTWHVTVALTPCAGGPVIKTFSALNTFHTGGTLTSTDNNPTPGNGPGQGIWEYRGHGRYSTHMQFYHFLPNGTVDGLGDIYQDTTMDWRGQSYTSAIVSRLLNTDGSLRVEVCGTAQGTRVPIDSNP